MCSYDSGEVHRYSLQSTMKLRPSLQARKDLAANVREAKCWLRRKTNPTPKQTNNQASPNKTTPSTFFCNMLRCVVEHVVAYLLQPGDATLDAQWLFSHPTALELSAIVVRNVTYTPPKDVR